MTPEKKRIAIAEFEGWKIEVGRDWTLTRITRPDKSTFRLADPRIEASGLLPNYLNSLDAMRGPLGRLSLDQRELYFKALQEIVEKDGLSNYAWRFRNPTAAQQADALLRAIGKEI